MKIIWNTDDFFRRMGQAETEATNHAKMAIENVAEDLLAKSQNEVPLKDSILQNSGHTEHRENESFVVYGGMSAPYAIYQHEGKRADGTHVIKKHTYPNRKTKYLEDPIKNNMDHYLRIYGQVFARMFV